jgi:amidohydrolase
MTASQLKERASSAFEAVADELRQTSRWMYENPELAYQEFESSRRLAAFLESRGFDVTYPAHGLETSFEATVGSAGPRVVICCEYDALPDVGHACGHNVIATAAVGAGAALAGLADELGIRVTVLGTPAEEDGGGKVDLIEAGAFEDVAAAMMVHPTWKEDVIDPHFLAIQSYVVEYRGQEAHAAGAPHRGINALDAFVQAYNNVSTMRQQMLPTDRIHSVITYGGGAANVIPGYTRSEWMIRATTKDRLDELIDKTMACFQAGATATGCTVEVTPDSHPYTDLKTSEVIADLYAANSEALGRPMKRFADLEDQSTGSTDMGNVSQVVPAIHPGLHVDSEFSNHHAGFAAATITESGEKALRDGALAMAWTIIDMADQAVWEGL